MAAATETKYFPTGSPRQVAFGAFEAKNGLLIVGVANDRLFVKFAQAIGRPEWTSDPRFRTSADRLAHRDFLGGEIKTRLVEKTKEEWIELLEAAGVPCAPILSIPEVLAQPQTEAMDIFRDVSGLGVKLVNLPFSFDGERAAFDRKAPLLGEHNGEMGAMFSGGKVG